MSLDPLFQTHSLNKGGLEKLHLVRSAFDGLLVTIDAAIGCHAETRELAIAKTKLEEACFYAIKAVAILPENQGEP